MKKGMLLMLAVLVTVAFFSVAPSKAAIPVTFQVDMSIKVQEDVFTPGEDNVTLRGDFMSEAGLSGDWFPDEGPYTLADDDQDTVYTVTIDLPDSTDGGEFFYKYAINDATWEDDPNRDFTVSSPETVLPVTLFNRDSVVTVMAINFLNFTADLTDIYGSGDGYFDPDRDSLLVMGLDWVGATVEGGDRKFTEDAFNPGIFHTTMVIQGVEGDSTKWKSKAYPDEHFFNWGWEITSDKWHVIREDSAEIDIGPFKPDIFPMQPPLAQSQDVLFQVDMTDATNQYTGGSINPDDLIFVGLKGQNEVLGAWGGDWLPSDTTSTDTTDATMWVLNDNGENGDAVAGDDIWSITITFPEDNAGGPSLYRYSAHYPGADTINNGSQPLYNEFPGGVDHWVNITEEDSTIVVSDDFGVYESRTSTAIEQENGADLPGQIALSQNYPNPFNPTTRIQYSVPANNSDVRLTVYNLLGREVATLVNTKKAAGTYSAGFHGADYSSGIYFYTLTVGEQQITKKMILVK